jgi:hypothetical protein
MKGHDVMITVPKELVQPLETLKDMDSNHESGSSSSKPLVCIYANNE